VRCEAARWPDGETGRWPDGKLARLQGGGMARHEAAGWDIQGGRMGDVRWPDSKTVGETTRWQVRQQDGEVVGW